MAPSDSALPVRQQRITTYGRSSAPTIPPLPSVGASMPMSFWNGWATEPPSVLQFTSNQATASWQPQPSTDGQTGKPGTSPSGFRTMSRSMVLLASAATTSNWYRCSGSVDRRKPQTDAAGMIPRSTDWRSTP
jgi:hypothetical protein